MPLESLDDDRLDRLAIHNGAKKFQLEFITQRFHRIFQKYMQIYTISYSFSQGLKVEKSFHKFKCDFKMS